ncbi:tetraspanin-17 [Phthorimaea operculella]|nr:tetraspanin-17 [Phthorimaea operculella]
MVVPPSCCVQRVEDASYLNPAPVNQSRCQEVKPDPAFRYVPGCLGKLEDWYQQQYIIFMLALFVVALFKLGILLSTVFSCIRLRKRNMKHHSFIMKSIDNNTNENIYERKMGSIQDEPIMAKYIQPNNFYSPRVRNPRIFPSKPNEMV